MMRRPLSTGHCHAEQRPLQAGYTLIEILVVISIILILATLTLTAVNFTRDADRVSNGARQVQSFLAGARDRAIYEKEPRGVRLFIERSPNEDLDRDGVLDPGEDTNGNGVLDVASAESRTISTMAYIAPGGTWSSPENSRGVNLERLTVGGDVVVVRGFNNPGWWNLKRRGWLVDGLRIRIPKGPTGNWYPLDTSQIDTTAAPTDDQELRLVIPYSDPGDPNDLIAFRDLTYEIELPYRLLPQDPAILPEGTVIDLDASKVPDTWRPTNTGTLNYSGYMDIVFSPRGNIIGDAAATGVIHFYVGDSEDSLFLKEQFIGPATSTGLAGFDATVAAGAPFVPMDVIIADPADPNIGNAPVVNWLGPSVEQNYVVKDRRLVSVFTQTGAISVHNVNAYVGLNNAAIVDRFDPFDIDGDGYLGPSAPGDANEPDGLADDPYRFAETGDVAP